MFIQTSSHNRPHPKGGPAVNSTDRNAPVSVPKTKGEVGSSPTTTNSVIKPEAEADPSPIDLLQLDSTVGIDPRAAASEGEPEALIEPLKLFPLTKRQTADMLLSEVAVELPETLMALTSLEASAPKVASAVQGGVTAMALARGVYCLSQPGVDNKLEGASSLALSVASGLTFVPGGGAALAGSLAMAGHAGAEVALGVRGLAEELPKGFKDMDYRNLSSGVLGTVKGATAFLPLFLPQTESAVNWIQLGTLVGKAVLDSSIGRPSPEPPTPQPPSPPSPPLSQQKTG